MATYKITCGNAIHRIERGDDGRMSLLNCNMGEEETLDAMGLPTSACYQTYHALIAEPEIILEQASHLGQVDMVKLALACGAYVGTRFCSPITRAAEGGHAGTIDVLAQNGADVNGCEGRPLRRAAKSGHLEAVKMLLNHGADIHQLFEGALYMAAKNNHLDVVKFLVEKGANIDKMLSKGKRYLMAACDPQVVALLNECERET